jgi:hypothetical protein
MGCRMFFLMRNMGIGSGWGICGLWAGGFHVDDMMFGWWL